MQPLPPVKTHVGSPRSGSINRLACRGTAARILPIIMAAGVLICTALQLWGWFSQGKAFEPLYNKATVSLRATRSAARSSSNNRRWVLVPAAVQTQQSTSVDQPSPAVNPPPLHSTIPSGTAATAQNHGTASTDNGSGTSTASGEQQQQQQQEQNHRKEAAPAVKLISVSAPDIPSSRASGATGEPQQQAVHHSLVAPSPVERTAAHPSSKVSVPDMLMPKQHQAKPGAAMAGAGTTGASSASVLQLTQAYEESLAALSTALQLSKTKADQTAALREQLVQAYKQQHPKASTAMVSSASSSKQPKLQSQQQQQQKQKQAVIGHIVAEVAAAKASSQQAQAGSGIVVSGAASRHNSGVSKTWCTRRSGKRVRVVIGVYTGFSAPDAQTRYSYSSRRAALRASWFPGNTTERARLESEHGVVIRFVVGSSKDAKEEAALLQEEQAHGDFIRLPLQEDYRLLPSKTRAFFKMVTDMWDPDWVVKMDDDVYLNIPRLLETARQWDKMGAEYVGCMNHGVVWTDPGSRWYEPANILVGPTYWLHAYGSIYAIAGPTASCAIAAAFDRLRLLSNEATSVGLWMLASNVVHFEDMRLCSPVCTNASVAVQRTECAGLCNPVEDLKLLHADSSCSMPPEGHLLYHKSSPEYAVFERMWVE